MKDKINMKETNEYSYRNIHTWEKPEKVFYLEKKLETYTKFFALFEKEYPESSTKILDVGCGNGNFHTLLKQRGYRDVVGIDFAKWNIKKAMENHPCYKYYVQDVCKPYPFEDNNFDVVVSIDVLEHVISPRMMIGEMLRVVKTSGCCVLSTPNGLRLEFETIAYKHGIQDSVFQYTTPGILNWMVRGLGGRLMYVNLSARIPPFLHIYSKFVKEGGNDKK